MKKILLIIICIAIIMYITKYEEYNISENTIRFRVISNSNSSKDILMKEMVVKEISSDIFKKDLNYEETENNIYNNLNNIEEKINILFKKNNYNENFNIVYGNNYFPEKTFNNKKYNEGIYKSLVISIGEAKGNNYFCILYPSLCTIDDNKEEIQNNKKYKFKIIEIINKLL